MNDVYSKLPVWEGTRSKLPVLTSDTNADFVVIGLGGSGLSTVKKLLELGQDVVGIDAGPIAGCAAGRNGGFLLAGLADFYHDAIKKNSRSLVQKIYRLTCQQIERMQVDAPDFVRCDGSLRIADSDEEFDDCKMQLEKLLEDGFAAQIYEGSEGRGLLVPGDGVFHPFNFWNRLAALALSANARLFEFTKAVDISSGEVVTPSGRIRCKTVIVTVDGNLENVFPELVGMIRTARLQMLSTRLQLFYFHLIPQRAVLNRQSLLSFHFEPAATSTLCPVDCASSSLAIASSTL